MTILTRSALSLGLGILGYVIGSFGGVGLVYLLSNYQHDRSTEAAMTGTFIVGPLVGLLFAIVSFVRSK